MSLKAELHQHSRYSQHSDRFLGADTTVENIAKTCKRKGISIFSITDHNTIDSHEEGKFYAKKYGLIFLPGAEINTRQGHLLALGIHTLIPKNLSLNEAADAVHAQGGVAVAAHPFQIPFGCMWRFVGSHVDAIEGQHAYAIGNGLTNWVNNRFAHKPVIAGSDAHYLDEIGLVYTLFPDSVKNAATALAAIRENRITLGGANIGMLAAAARRLHDILHH